MKVAFISSLNGGVGTYIVALVNELSKHVETIDLYLFSGYRHIPIPELPENVTITTNQKNGISLLIESFFSISHFKNYDIIHLNCASFFLPVYITKKIWCVPYIYTSHGYPQPEAEKGLLKLAYTFESFSVKPTSKNADEHIAISNYTRALFQEKCNVAPRVIYHGINSKIFTFDENTRNNIRKSLSITDDQFLILFVGTFNKGKNLLTLIDSIPRVVDKGDNVRFLLIGSGVLYNQLIYKIKKLKIEEFVIVKKHVPEISDYYFAADLFILPSINEMFGFVLLEAMASGLPIIASKGGACPEVVGDAGLLFDPRNSENLADKIIELINNKELYEKLKERGLERVKQFTWERVAEQYYEVYKKVLEGH